MESSPAFLCLWLCFIVYASTSNGCSEIPVVENAVVSESSKKNQYSEGDTLEYNCEHGYISQRKITYQCTNNEWKKGRDVKCSLKPCESPQDILNGRYIIEKGRNFVFGTTIKYICNDGYQIMSRFDTRTCREGGWDNQLPECEEVSCQRIVPEGNVRVAGLPEHSDDFIRSGHRLTFSCEGNGLILRGQKVITCQSNGEWSSPLPKCVEATCLLQSNRTVGDLKIKGLPDIEGPVKPGHKLTFSCTGEGMTLNGEKDITCLSNGEWSSPFPICQEIACEGEQLINVEILYGHPSIVSPYRPRHVLLFRCTDVNLKLYGRRAIECQSDGKWDYPYPTCREIRCEVPRDKHVHNPHEYFRGDLKLGERISYYCFQDGQYQKSEATCTQDGWTPKPLCPEIRCEVPRDQHLSFPDNYFRGDMKLGTKHNYYCESGYEKKAEEATCTRDGWTPNPLCTEITCELQSTTSGVKKIIPEGKTMFRAGESVEIICSVKRVWFFKETSKKITCQDNGEWDHKPGCEGIRCEVPRDQHVSHPDNYFRGDMKLGTKHNYYCESGYEKKAEEATCTRDGWTPNPLCTEIICELQSTTSGVKKIIPEGKTIFRAGESVEITCSEKGGYDTKETRKSFRCQENGEWDHKPGCGEIRCKVPRDQHVYRPSDYFSGDMKLGTKKSYRCEPGYNKRAEKATCTQDGWTPDPLCAEITCELQSTTSGVKKIIPEGKTMFRAGESVEITCSEKGGYDTKETRKSFRCQENGEWDHKPGCGEIRCKVPRDQHVSHPDYYFSGDLKLGTKIYYYCESEYNKMADKATCTQDGWTPNPLCAVPGKCGPPPPVNDGDTTDITKKEYNTGERVEYFCFSKYTLDTRSPFSNILTCQQGEWGGKVKCLKPCTVTAEIMKERGIDFAYGGEQKLFAPHDDHLTFKCLWGKRPVGVGFRQKCNDGVMTLPECV
ncbi:complement factor H-related protein 4-like isoform X4 [Carassius carassius]|uniref:complement factor H-related protein 4-like isoform X4 n=1 Tax=Carassius carassius TaxID=217509 RepID=UPI0028696E0E|nr:complement factor H-related protein 4-like isoform X4 [Carassius carassius]